MKHFESLLAAVSVSALMAACSSTPVAPETTSAAPVSTVQPTQAPTANANAAPNANVGTSDLPPHKDPNSLISKERSVYFDYDDFSVKSQYNPLIERQGKYLQGHSELAIRIEGNADERGSAEYNLALGQKRAEAVERALKIYGVRDKQMEAVSFGKERPKATGHDEAAWAENRRADIVYR